MDEWQGRPLGPNALADEPEHRRFMERAAAELSEYDATLPELPALPPAELITRQDLDKRLNELCGTMLTVCKKFVSRLERLEAQSMGKYVGAWQKGADYQPGNFCTASGSLWHCKAATGTRPGTCPDAWTLVAKRGRDAR